MRTESATFATLPGLFLFSLIFVLVHEYIAGYRWQPISNWSSGTPTSEVTAMINFSNNPTLDASNKLFFNDESYISSSNETERAPCLGSCVAIPFYVQPKRSGAGTFSRLYFLFTILIFDEPDEMCMLM